MRLYHYTKLENLPLIVQEDKLSFWLTNYKDFDDRSEGEYILKVQQEFYPTWKYNNIDRYVLCLSCQYDNLPMWKEYASDATGIALEIETDNIKHSIFVNLLSCDYNAETIKKRSDAIRAIKDRYKVMDAEDEYADYCKRFPDLRPQEYKDFCEKIDVMDASVELIRVKHPCFHYEAEIRLIVQPFNNNFHYCFRNGKQRICYEYHIDKMALTKIYVGSNNNDSVVKNVKAYMGYVGYDDFDVEKIDLPYKSH